MSNENHKSAVQSCKQANIRLNHLETLSASNPINSVPTHFEIDFLSECNLKCVMCHQAKYIMPHDQLSQENLDAIIDKLPYVETVMIAGLGEPLLYKKIDSILPYLSRYCCYSHMFTNGMLIDKRLNLLKHLKKVSISFDGANKTTFEYLRKGANFNKIVSNIKKLHDYAPNVLLATSTVISNKNVGEIAEIVSLAEACGIKEVHLSPVDHTPTLSLSLKDYEIFLNQLDTASHSTVKIFNNINRFHFKRINSQVSNADNEVVSKNLYRAEASNKEKNAHNRSTKNKYIHQLPLDAEIEELIRRTNRINTISNRIESNIKNGHIKARIPACTALWKYGFFRSNNQVRLCPYADINVGNIEHLLSNGFNSDVLNIARQQFINNEHSLSVCTTCNDDHRKFKHKELLAFEISD